MTENHKSHVLGKVKLVLARWCEGDDWEVLNINFWHDGFDYDLDKHQESYAREVLGDNYLMGGDYVEILREHAKGDDLQVFEVIGELHHESWKSWTDCGYEYDAREWLENVKVREIKGEDLEWFKEEDPFRWKDFSGEEIEEEGDNVGNG
jgi:hypothetical protein